MQKSTVVNFLLQLLYLVTADEAFLGAYFGRFGRKQANQNERRVDGMVEEM